MTVIYLHSATSQNLRHTQLFCLILKKKSYIKVRVLAEKLEGTAKKLNLWRRCGNYTGIKDYVHRNLRRTEWKLAWLHCGGGKKKGRPVIRIKDASFRKLSKMSNEIN